MLLLVRFQDRIELCLRWRTFSRVSHIFHRLEVFEGAQVSADLGLEAFLNCWQAVICARLIQPALFVFELLCEEVILVGNYIVHVALIFSKHVRAELLLAYVIDPRRH